MLLNYLTIYYFIYSINIKTETKDRFFFSLLIFNTLNKAWIIRIIPYRPIFYAWMLWKPDRHNKVGSFKKLFKILNLEYVFVKEFNFNTALSYLDW